jgi:23S rRNA pseudouridine2604 synthase
MNIELDVPLGKYRHLTKEELKELDRLTGESIKTEEASVEQKIKSSSTKPVMDRRENKESAPKKPKIKRNNSKKGRNRES